MSGGRKPSTNVRIGGEGNGLSMEFAEHWPGQAWQPREWAVP